MHPTPSASRGSLEMRLWVPADGELRGIAAALAAKVAEYLGTAVPDAQSVAAQVEDLAARLGPGEPGGLLAFDFRQVEGELVIEGTGNGRTSELRHTLPA
jgi:hypothetical protein